MAYLSPDRAPDVRAGPLDVACPAHAGRGQALRHRRGAHEWRPGNSLRGSRQVHHGSSVHAPGNRHRRGRGNDAAPHHVHRRRAIPLSRGPQQPEAQPMKINSASSGRSPRGRRPSRLTAGRMGLYAFVVTAALVFLLPFWVMVTTSLKPMSEIRTGNIFAPPLAPSFDAWVAAWSSACTGLQCEGVSVEFVNSVIILIPSLILSLLFGAVNGYALSLWRVRGAN